jgi:hypothetical protein
MQLDTRIHMLRMTSAPAIAYAGLLEIPTVFRTLYGVGIQPSCGAFRVAEELNNLPLAPMVLAHGRIRLACGINCRSLLFGYRQALT